MTTAEIADLVHEQPITEDATYIFMGKTYKVFSTDINIRKNSTYDLIYNFLSENPDLLPEISDACRDFATEHNKPHAV